MSKNVFLGYEQNTIYINSKGEEYFQNSTIEFSKHISNKLQPSDLEQFLKEVSKTLKKRKFHLITNLENKYYTTIQNIIENKKYFKKATTSFQAKTFLEQEGNNWFASICSSQEAKRNKKYLAREPIERLQPNLNETKKLITTYCALQNKYSQLILKDAILSPHHEELKKYFTKNNISCTIIKEEYF